MKQLSKNMCAFFSILLIVFCICYGQNSAIFQKNSYIPSPLSDKDYTISTMNSTL